MPTTRLSTVFAGMTSSCPKEIAMYGRCVVFNAEALNKGICEKDFQDLKHCFRNTRPKKR